MSQDSLSLTFGALADPTRRAILARLADGEATATELAEPFEMSQPAISKHLKVLERAGLIARRRQAQWHRCSIAPDALREAADWIGHYRRFWEESFDRLDAYLRELQTRMTPAPPAGDAVVERRKAMATEATRAAEGAATFALHIVREFDAPREVVFELWTKPEHLRHWWGPRDGQRRNFTTPEVSQDFTAGGSWRICMVSPDGKEYWSSGSYSEIAPPERIAFSFTWDPELGQPEHRTEVTVDFAELPGGRTRMDFRQSPFFTAFDRDDHTGGWNDCFDRLGERLAATREDGDGH